MRVADNMRNVAVTEGDKVEAQLKFGWEVDAYPVNEIAESVAAVSESDTNALVDEYYEKYDILLEGRDPEEFYRPQLPQRFSYCQRHASHGYGCSRSRRLRCASRKRSSPVPPDQTSVRQPLLRSILIRVTI